MQRKRNLNKARLHSEADRLQGLLLSSLAKEKAVQEALGTELASQLTSPKKKVKPSENEKEDIYKLPPIPEESVGADIAQQSSDSSFDEKSSRYYYNVNLNSIDVTSKRFLDLPPDVRHEILTDLKEKRKESSWGRLHELPAQSNDFSEFQMKRLLKRRQVQVSLESAEKEMGGKCLSLAEMEAMLTDEGILNAASSSAAKAIASNENALFLHVKNLQDAMKEEKRRLEEEAVKKGMDAKKEEEEKETPMEDEDEDLQTAIQLSLLDTIPIEDQAKEVKLRPDQKKFLRHAAKDAAKDYMIEYGGFNAEEVDELVMSDEENDRAESSFLHNDTYILKGHTKSDIESTATIEIDDSKSEVSSDADSDFIEVPEIEADVPLHDVHPLEMNREPDADLSKDFRREDLIKQNGLQIQIQKTEMLDDDLFADIFNNGADDEAQTKIDAKSVDSHTNVEEDRKVDTISIDSDDEPEILISERTVSAVKPPVVLATILDSLSAEISDIATIKLDSLPSIEIPNEATEIAPNHSSTLSKLPERKSSLDSILNQLNTEMTDILNNGIDSIKPIELSSTSSKSPETRHSQLNKPVPESGIFKTPTKSTEKDQPPPKVVSPFFRKKTPSPRQKRKTDDTEEEISPKIARTLFPGSSSDVEPLQLAASNLRESKTTDELTSMAANIREEKRELELERNKQDRFGMNITERMSSDCKNLLKLFGVPYMDAPMEAESQCAFLNQIELTDGTITDDSDIWLFGGQTVYKHFFNQQKHVLEFRSENINKLYSLDRHKMIQLSILVGNDYTNGIQGIGAVTAMEILSEFSSKGENDDASSEEMSLLAGLSKFKDWFRNDRTNFTRKSLRSKLKNISISDDFPSRRVVEALLKPVVDDSDEKFSWGQPDAESIRELAKTTFGWTYSKTDDILLPVLKKLNEKKAQQSIKNYFKSTGLTNGDGSIAVSKRVRHAIDVMANKVSPEDNVEKKPVKDKKPRKRAQKAEMEDKPETKKSTKTKTKSEEQQTPLVKLPGEGDDIIPQRESTMVEMDKNKQNAIELFKKSKRNQKK